MSLTGLCSRDEIQVFRHDHVQDDMAGWTEVTSDVRQTLRCRMHQMSRDEKVEHDLPLLSEAYTALFASDPDLTLHHKVVYKDKVYDVKANRNRSNQNWLWAVPLVHNPSLELDP